jgi:hypothetical protein
MEGDKQAGVNIKSGNVIPLRFHSKKFAKGHWKTTVPGILSPTRKI